jgi:hypothetical protein
MASRSRRGPQPRLALRVGAWLERHGAAALVRLWSLLIRVLSLVALGVELVAGAAWRLFMRQRPSVKLAVAAGLVISALVAREWVRSLEPTVYVSDDTEALARVITSEVGTMSRQHQLHVAWATRNLAAERGQTIARMACTPCGNQGLGRPVSSRQPASGDTRALAQLVLLAPRLLDPTGGATHFIDPVLQDELAASGAVPGYAGNTYAVVRRRWAESYGWAPYYRLGPTLEFWGPAHPPRPRRRR